MVIWCLMWAATITWSLHTLVHRRLTVPDSIVDFYQSLLCWCRLWYPYIVCSLCICVCLRWIWPSNNFCILHTSICWCGTMRSTVTQGLHACDMACVHLARDVTNDMQLLQRLSRIKEEFSYLTRDVIQWRAASDKAFSHKRGMCTSR